MMVNAALLRSCAVCTRLIGLGVLLACSSEAATIAGEPVDSVVITSSPTSVSIGESVIFAAEARNSAGEKLQARSVTWTSLDKSIGTIGTSSGVFSGLSAGQARVVASADAKSDTALIQVSVASGAPPLLTEDFSTYTSTADMLADPRDLYLLVEDVQTGQIKLDESVGFGTSPKSMRYDYPDRTAIGGSGTTGRCTDYTISRRLRVNALKHVWIEVYLRFSSGFTVEAPTAWGCASAPELKLVHASVGGGDGRYNLEMQPTRWIFGYPDNEAIAIFTDPAPATLLDEQWHRFRFEFKVSSESGMADGIARVWIDDVLASNLSGAVINRTDIWGVSLGRNINQGPGALQSIWWGRVRLFDQNPGW